MGCIPVASATFRTRPDVSCVVHIHPIAVMAVAVRTAQVDDITSG